MKKIILILVVVSISITFSTGQNIGISNDAAFTTPQSPLHIYWTSDGNLLQLSRSSAANTGLTFSVATNDYSIFNRENNALIFGTNNTERMRILNTGAVRIGYGTAATDALQVGGYGFSNPTIFMGSEGGSAPGYGRIGLYGTTYGTFSTILSGGGLSYFNSSNQYVFGGTTASFATDFIDIYGSATYPDPLSAYTSDAASSAAIYGQSTGAGGTGVWGSATADANSWGIYGSTSAGIGIVGNATSSTGYGIYGLNSAAASTGIGFAGAFRSQQWGGSALAATLGPTLTYLPYSAFTAYVDNYNAATTAIYAKNNYSTAAVNKVWALDAYMYNSLSNDGNGYAYTSNNSGGLQALTWNSPTYSFGVAGFSYNDDVRCGGVLGAEYDGNPWGALGYENSGGSKYGVYGSSAYASGTGKNNSIKTGIGVGGYSDLMGGTFRGMYGTIIKGERIASYIDGKQITNDIISQVHTIPNSNTKISTYVPTSTTVDVIDRGVIQLNNGIATISFKKEFRDLVSDTEPIIITITPIGRSANLYIQNNTKNGFTVVDDSPNKSNNLTITWIAIGVQKGYENPVLPPEILAKDFDQHLDKFLYDDGNTSGNGEPMWWDGQNLRFDPIPEENINKEKPHDDLKTIEIKSEKLLKTKKEKNQNLK